MGQRTATAIRTFEEAHGLPPTGTPIKSVVLAVRGAAAVAGVSVSDGMASASARPGGRGAVTGSLDLGMGPGTTTVVSAAGLRAIAPLTQDGRLLVGAPLWQANQAGPKIMFLGREIPKAAVDFALYRDLALLAAHPEAIMGQRWAREYADRLLSPDVWAQYLVRCRGGCTGATFEGWVGADEFAREDSYNAFVADMGPILAAAGPKMPLAIRAVRPVILGSYDSTRGAFPLSYTQGVGDAGDGLIVDWAAWVPENQGTRIVYPQEVELDREAARALRTALSGDAPAAYVIADYTIESAWNHQHNWAETSERLEKIGLYADPAGNALLHDLTPTPDAVAAIAAPTTDAPIAEVPTNALLLKLAGSAMSDDTMLKLTAIQIEADQGARAAGSATPRLFEEAELAGRHVDFVAPELMPAYRERLAAALAETPTRVVLPFGESLQSLQYRDGAIRRRGYSRETSMDLGTLPFVEKNERTTAIAAYAGAGGLMQSFALQGAMPPEALPVSAQQFRPGQVYLALDRQVIVPPLPMDAKSAEALWTGPVCDRADSEAYWQGQGTMTDAEFAALEARVAPCRSERRDMLTMLLDLDVTAANYVEDSWVLGATVLGLRVYGPGDQLLAEFAPDALGAKGAATVSTPAELAAPESAETPEAAATTSLEVMKARLASADIAGIRLGMPLAEAEAAATTAVGNAIVATLGTEERDAYRQQVDQIAPGFEPPLLWFRHYGNEDESEGIAIYTDAESGEFVRAVVRTVTVPGGDVRAALRTQLSEKLGPPLEYRGGMESEWSGATWTDVADEVAVAGFYGSPCNAELDQIYARREGPPDQTTSVQMYGLRYIGPGETAGWRGCSPVARARLTYQNGKTHLVYGLFDMSGFAGAIDAIMAEKAARPIAMPKL